MIFTDRTIIVQKGTSSINDTIILYRGDKGVEIRFTLNEGSPFKFGSGASPNIIEKTEAAYGQLIIKRPNDLPAVFSEIAPTNEGKIVFTITAEMIDEITEVGYYTFQIRLFDENQESRATIPEVIDGIEIREPIASEDGTNEVGVATVGYALTTAAANEDTFDAQGNYNKTTWGTGDRITAAKLNKMETGIDEVNKKIVSNAGDISIADTGNYFTSTNVEGALQEVGSQIKDITSGTIIIKTNGEDDSDVIQNALNEGYNIVIKGNVYTTKKIIISKPNQSIVQEFGTWYIKHIDDNAIHILSYNNKIKCNFSGEKQPSGQYNISCIVVGQGGTEGAEKGRSCDLSHTQIKNYQGNGVRWINGARINTFYLEIYRCNGHGFFADIGCKDNNDGNFDNMSVVNCSEYGIYFKKYKSEYVADDVISDDVGLRQSGNNTFRNTKGFGNRINFVIETDLNVGTIFSEDAVDNYDIFSGNYNTIKYLGCIESSNNFRNTGNNEIEFLDSFNNNNRDQFRSKKIIVSDTYAANMEIYQTNNNAFLDTFTGTYDEVVVKHTKGTGTLRTDEFDVIKIGGSSFKFVHQKKIQLSNQVVEAGGYITIDYGESFAVPYSAILKQFVVLNQESDLIVTAVVRRESSGWCRPLIKIFNPTKQNITLSDLSSIDYCAYA